MKKSAVELLPRSTIWSRWPSPCAATAPGTVRITSAMERRSRSSISRFVTAVTACGTSTRGVSVRVADEVSSTP